MIVGNDAETISLSSFFFHRVPQTFARMKISGGIGRTRALLHGLPVLHGQVIELK